MNPHLNHLRLIVRTINELHALPDNFAQRRDHLLMRTCDVFGARLGVLAIGREIEGGCTFRAKGIAGRCPAMRRGIITQLLGGGRSDGLLSRLRSRSARLATATRRQIMGDAEWYASAFYTTLIAAEGLDDSLWSVYRPAPESKEFAVMVLYQASGDGPGFGIRDAHLFNLLNDGLDWLYDPVLETAGSARENVTLPPRLDRLLTCLMSGHSEKQAARRLSISPHTVHAYVKDLYRALNVNSRSELLATAFSWSAGSSRDRAQSDGESWPALEHTSLGS